METYNDINILQLLGDKHTDWIKMVRSLEKKKSKPMSLDLANELVQEMYLRIYKYVDRPERIMFSKTEINTMFVFITLRNIYFNHINNKKKYDKYMVNLDELEEDEYDILYDNELDTDFLNAQTTLEDELLEEINSWHHYDAKLFKIIFYERVTMRQLSRDTGISVSSIFNTIKKCKEKLRIKFADNYDELQKLK